MKLIDRALKAARAARLHHDDGVRLGRHRGRGDEARRLRFRHQADQSRQARDSHPPRAAQPRDGDRKYRAQGAGAEKLRAGKHHRPLRRRWRRCSTTVRQVAPTRATVCIAGESGTGKELVAHALHHLSHRRESEIRGGELRGARAAAARERAVRPREGAFTGASERRVGRFEQADGGTLFLDEIGEIDPAHADENPARVERADL